MRIFLYVKTHNVTGMKYFGKTYRDPMKYRGSGVYWKRHLDEHGEDVTTIIIGEFEDGSDELVDAAINFSESNNVVVSKEWANLIVENGLDGKPVGSPGHLFTPAELEKLSIASKKKWQDAEFRATMLVAQSAAWTEERRAQRSDYLTQEHWTEERKAQHSQIMQDKWLDPEFQERAYDIGGLLRTESHNQNISKSLTGRTKSEEHRRALSEANKAKSTHARAPEGCVKVKTGVYLYREVTVVKAYSGLWRAEMDGEVLTDRSLKAVVVLINNKYLLKADR